MRNVLLLGAWAAMAYAANPVYVGTNHGLYRSTDAGGSWTRVNITLNSPLLSGTASVSSIAIDLHDPAKIYCVGNATARAFFATADAGRTWSTIPFVGMFGREVAVDFAGQVIYVTATATNGSGDNLLYKSTNAGATWTRLLIPSTSVPPVATGSAVFKFTPDLSVSGTIYVATFRAELFKSTDFGQTWTRVSSLITLPSGAVVGQTTALGLYQDPRNSQVLYLTADHGVLPPTCPLTNGGLCGIFKSTNGGTNFSGLSLPSSYVSTMGIGAPAGTAYATAEVGGLGGTVMKTSDGGDTWTPIKTGLFTPRSGRVWPDSNDPSTVYVDDSLARNSFNVSTDAGATFTVRVLPVGPVGCVPGNCSAPDIADVAIAPPTQPVITSVVNGASLQPGIAANTWVTIFGVNLAPGINNWDRSIVNGNLPSTVDGVSVMIGGKPAYVYFISPGQINVLTPDISPGAVSVIVTTPAGVSAPFATSASQFSDAFFTWPENQPVATRQDFSFAVKPGTFAGATTVAAKPGDVLILWATGFGPTNPAAPLGVAIPGDRTYATSTPATVTINDVPATVFGAALAPGAAGLFQIAVQVPSSIADGDWPVRATIGGVLSPTGVLLTVRR